MESIVVTRLNASAVRRWLASFGFQLAAGSGPSALSIARGNGQSLVFGPGTVLTWDRAARVLVKGPAAA